MPPDLSWLARFAADDVVAGLEPFLSEARRERIEAVLDRRLAGLTVAFEDLYDPHNGGAAVRTAELFGVGAIHAAEPNAPFRFAEPVAQGAAKWVSIHRHRSVAELLAVLRASGFQILGAVVDADRRLEDHDFAQPTALLFGNEHSGLTPPAVDGLTGRFSLPMHGFSQSFNLSVSVALALQIAAGERRRALGRPGDLDDAARVELRARYYALSVDRRSAQELVERHLGVSGETR